MSELDFYLFDKGLKEFNIEFNERQYEQFKRYYELLIEWNSFMNLTAITEWQEVVIKHFIDSLSLIKMYPNMTSMSYSIIDVGTGAGFPGIPLKIAFPSLNITLLDSLNKRVNFLNTVIDDLGLENINAFHGRAEDFGRNNSFREKYDICISRAVANLSSLSEFCLPFVKVGGSFISYKSDKIIEEAANASSAIELLGGEVSDSIEFNLPYSDHYRCLFVIDKIKNTPNKFPRKAGTPLKDPL